MNRALGIITTAALFGLLVCVFYRGQRTTQQEVELKQAQVRYARDSIAFARRRAALEDSLVQLALRGDSLRRALTVARQASAAGIITIRNLIARLPRQDRAAVTVSLGEIVRAGEACDVALANCEAQLAAERTGRREALARLQASDSLRTVTDLQRQDAERRARPSLLRDVWRAKAAVLPSLALAGLCWAR
jgi:hypothetical protein